MAAELSIVGLIAQASGVVKAVMLCLLGSSVLAWSITIDRALLYRQVRLEIERFQALFWSAGDLGKLFQRLSGLKKHEANWVEQLFLTGFKEFMRLKKQNSERTAILEGIERALRIHLSYVEEQLDNRLSGVATVASISPYIGLFGTVWGIMGSFQALGSVQQATLAMVAPSISEALIATAMGLLVAIPAVLAFNQLKAASSQNATRLQRFAEALLNIFHRQVHQGPVPDLKRTAPVPSMVSDELSHLSQHGG